MQAEDDFKFGLEMLLSDHKDLLEGKRVGLVTNPTGIDQDLNTTVDLLFEDSDIELTALYGPEHGVRGNAEAGGMLSFIRIQRQNYQYIVYTGRHVNQVLRC